MCSVSLISPDIKRASLKMEALFMPSLKRRSLRQVEGSDKKYSHLRTGDHGVGAVIGAAAASGDARLLLDSQTNCQVMASAD
jgi:hypothetical protein